MQLKFIAPLMPTLVEKPPEGGNWIHDVKFDSYRSQMVIDENARVSTPATAMTGQRNIATR